MFPDENSYIYAQRYSGVYIYFFFFSLSLRTLSQFLAQQEKPMEEREVLMMFHQIVAAIKHIHEHNILHRWVIAKGKCFPTLS